MQISLNWIKDYVTFSLSTDKLAHKLTMAGLEVESIAKQGNDTTMEFEITPNRADCLSMIGMAREIATVTEKKLNTPPIKKMVYPKKKVAIDIENTKDCSKYIGTIVEDVQLKQASSFIRGRIQSVGVRPISNIVDITNFILFEQGQPLHAFDLDKIEGEKVIVRRARKGEKIVTIDNEERQLDPSILVIADAKRPIAIAGIMGGKDTEVGPDTKNILLESAYFDPILIRRASRKLGLSSDSSYRFERGVDLAGVASGSDRAVSLILKEAGGTITHYTKAGQSLKKTKAKIIGIDIDDVNAYLGTKISATKIKRILKSLGFQILGQGNRLKITAPSFRSDIALDVDIIEEIARVIGYDNLPTSMPTVPFSQIDVHEGRLFRNKAREILLGQGLNEAITFTLISQDDLNRSGLGDAKALGLVNPLTLDQAVMKPSMLPSLLSVARGNINKGEKNVRLFELGKIYTEKAHEEERVAIVLSGVCGSDWRREDKPTDIFIIKGLLEQLFERLGLGSVQCEKESFSFLEEGQSGKVSLEGKQIGCVGKIREEVLRQWEIKDEDVFYAEVSLEKSKRTQNVKFISISEYPAIVQDVSLAVKEGVSFEQVKRIAFAMGENILRSVKFNELYLGDKIPSGHRGLVFSLVYQSKDRTLREEEVLKVHEGIIRAFQDELGAIRR